MPAGRSLVSNTVHFGKASEIQQRIIGNGDAKSGWPGAMFSSSGKYPSQPYSHQSIVPARVTEEVQQKAQKIARQIAQGLCLRGVLGIEFFMLADDRLLVNELAPRPHNSGHYSIEACNVSQFEAHVRSICGLEIPKITQHAPAVMVNLLGQHLTLARKKLIATAELGIFMITAKRKVG